MGMFDFLRRGASAEAPPRPRAEATSTITFTGMDDPALLEFIRNGSAARKSPCCATPRRCGA